MVHALANSLFERSYVSMYGYTLRNYVIYATCLGIRAEVLMLHAGPGRVKLFLFFVCFTLLVLKSCRGLGTFLRSVGRQKRWKWFLVNPIPAVNA